MAIRAVLINISICRQIIATTWCICSRTIKISNEIAKWISCHAISTQKIVQFFYKMLFYWFFFLFFNQNGNSVPEALQRIRSLKNISRGEMTANGTLPENNWSIYCHAFNIFKNLLRKTVEYAILWFQR